MPKELKGDMNGQGLHVGVVVARFNEIITRKLLDSAIETLVRHGVRDEDITVGWVPGSFELPVVAKTMAKNPETFGKGNVYVAQALEAWVAHVPGLKVVAPSTPADSKGLMIASIRDPDPVVFVEHVSLYGREGPVP